MAATTNPTYPDAVRTVGGDDQTIQSDPATGAASITIRTADGNDLVVRGGHGFTAWVRLPSGEDQLWTGHTS